MPLLSGHVPVSNPARVFAHSSCIFPFRPSKDSVQCFVSNFAAFLLVTFTLVTFMLVTFTLVTFTLVTFTLVTFMLVSEELNGS